MRGAGSASDGAQRLTSRTADSSRRQQVVGLVELFHQTAFEGFPCYNFAGGRGWLIADVSIECSGSPAALGALLQASAPKLASLRHAPPGPGSCYVQ